MRSQAQRGAKYDFVEYRGRSVDNQIAAASRSNDGPQISRVCFDYLYLALLAEKFSRAFGIAVAAPHGVPLAHQQMCQQRAGAAHTQNEDPHRLATLPHPTKRTTARNESALRGDPEPVPARRSGSRYMGRSGIYWPRHLSSACLRPVDLDVIQGNECHSQINSDVKSPICGSRSPTAAISAAFIAARRIPRTTCRTIRCSNGMSTSGWLAS